MKGPTPAESQDEPEADRQVAPEDVGHRSQTEEGIMETITSADGTSIAFERTGSGPPLVLVHGAALDRTFWEFSGVRRALTEHFTVYAVDRRGYGESGDADTYDLDREIEDVAAVVDLIDGPVTLLAHSYGALCALEAALQTDNLRALVLYEPAFTLDEGNPFIEALSKKIRPMLEAGENEQAIVFQLRAAGMPEAHIDAARSAPGWQELVDAAHVLLPREHRVMIDYAFDPAPFADITTPTLLLVGGETPDLPKASAEAVDDAFPNSRIATIDGAGHFAMLTAQDRFIDEVLSFIHEQQR